MLKPGKLVTYPIGRRFKGWSGRYGIRGCAVLLVCAGLALTLGFAALTASSAPSDKPLDSTHMDAHTRSMWTGLPPMRKDTSGASSVKR